MNSPQNLHDLFEMELQDLYDAEKQITRALPKMIEAASDPDLKEGFEKHLEQTEKQMQRLEEIVEDLEMSLGGKRCAGMQGVLKEGEEVLEEDMEGAVKDAALIAAAQRVEHYEIAGYGTVVAMAKQMGHTKAQELLEETLEEEKGTDKQLSSLAESTVNPAAMNSSDS